jgi:hypothetical protein
MATKKKMRYVAKEVRETIDSSYACGTPVQIKRNIEALSKLYGIKNAKIGMLVNDRTTFVEEVFIVGTRKVKASLIKNNRTL